MERNSIGKEFQLESPNIVYPKRLESSIIQADEPGLNIEIATEFPNEGIEDSNADKLKNELNDQAAGSNPSIRLPMDQNVVEGRNLGMTKESTAWDVYNNESRKKDAELIKETGETL
ncbi:hypothetical protein M408DRAFT_137158 [Serendipita vermifera MAFF 305830]|uniref:Uncharacterized protein n=1 Tax=Serendipita vermifera MAFF 305830 TaxID=933852 RepID=A0A0C3B947_SERVB|nr:hypothetical protein M408DRAFT_137158 [Serendipita vermifera MAFF 305830]